MQNVSTSEVMLGVVLILPLISCIAGFLVPERYSWVASISSSIFLLSSAVLSIVLFFSNEIIVVQIPWFEIGTLNIDFILALDATSRLMIMVVAVVSFLIHVYSTGYMAGDPGIRRYFSMLGFFTFSMLGIILADHILLLFMFWELVGFSSYMLIGHWMEKPAAAKAAQKAFLFNRIGDAVFLIGIIIMLIHPSSGWMTAAQLCVFAGIIAKSAQLPLFSWLPDAMEGPTPVSALLHAATMVAAGVYLLIRVSPLLTETSLIVITITGSVTALFGAVCALNQFDIKKILAYSTISQLGLMVLAVGLGAKDAALLHLFTHAFFKAGLFLAAGSVIHALIHHQLQSERKFDVQDIRNLGGLRRKLPITFLTFCITGASLAGIPFFSGFLSKESILTVAWNITDASSLRWIVVTIILIVSFFTVLYTFRMIRFIFFGTESKVAAHESPWVMRIPMLVLAFASSWFVVSFNPFSLGGWFTKSFSGVQTNTITTLLSAVTVLLALLTAWLIYRKSTSPKAMQIIQNGFRVDWFYQKAFGVFFSKLSSITISVDTQWIDGILHFTAYAQVSIAHGVSWFDRFVVDGIVNTGARLTKTLGSFTRSFQSGKIQLYIFWAVGGLIIFLFFALI